MLSLTVALLSLVACEQGVEYSQYVSLSDGWQAHNPALFQVEVADSIAPKDLFIMVRNTEQYPFSNLFLITKMEEPNSNKVIVDTLEYEMATPDGKWLGDGYSAVKESKLWYKEHFVFPTKGKYNIKIEQAMRKIGDNDGVPVLNGITEVGLRVENR